MKAVWSKEDWANFLPNAEFLGASSALERVETFFVDSRRSSANGCFVPLSGERTDGHKYLVSTLEQGTRVSLCSKENWSLAQECVRRFPDAALVVVENVLSALTRFATLHLDRFSNLIRIGITGSNGKTTTKEMLASVLKSVAKTFYTPGNLNSEIGLPLSALGVRSDDRFAVFEMGINHKGEMDALAAVVRPFVSMITNVGTAHIGIIGSKREIALEKKKIFSRSSADSHAVLPSQDEYFNVLKEGFSGSVHPFGTDDSRFEWKENRGLLGSTFRWNGVEIALSIPGKHNVKNALAVIAACEILGIDLGSVKKGLEAVRPSFGRSEVLHGDVTLLLDCYNANYDSMEKLFELLDELDGSQRLVVVLGSMRELGSQTAALHRDLGKRAAKLNASAIFYFGDEAEDSYKETVAARFHGKVEWTSDFDQLRQSVGQYTAPGDLVILKGSRGVELERLVDLWFTKKESSVHVL